MVDCQKIPSPIDHGVPGGGHSEMLLIRLQAMAAPPLILNGGLQVARLSFLGRVCRRAFVECQKVDIDAVS